MISKKDIINYIIIFFLWSLFSTGLIFLASFVPSYREVLRNHLWESIYSEIVTQDIEEATSQLISYQISSEEKNILCNWQQFKLDSLDTNIYTNFFISSLQKDVGNNLFYLIEDIQDCTDLFERNLINDSRLWDCKIKKAISELIISKAIEPKLEEEILENVPKFQNIITAFSEKNCNTLREYSKNLLNLCNNPESFNLLKDEIFQESMSIICKS